MKRSKFTEEQILFALKQADSGQPVGDVCRQMGISEAQQDRTGRWTLSMISWPMAGSSAC